MIKYDQADYDDIYPSYTNSYGSSGITEFIYILLLGGIFASVAFWFYKQHAKTKTSANFDTFILPNQTYRPQNDVTSAKLKKHPWFSERPPRPLHPKKQNTKINKFCSVDESQHRLAAQKDLQYHNEVVNKIKLMTKEEITSAIQVGKFGERYDYMLEEALRKKRT